MTAYSEPLESFVNHKPNVMSRELIKAMIEKIGGEDKFLDSYDYIATNHLFTGVEGIYKDSDVVELLNKNFAEIKTTFDNMALANNLGAGIEYLLSSNELREYDLTAIEIVDSFYAPLDSAEKSSSQRVSLCFWISSELYHSLCSSYKQYLPSDKRASYSDDIQAFILSNDMSDELTIGAIEQFGGERKFLSCYKEVATDGINTGYGYWFGHNHLYIFFKDHTADIIDFINDEAKNLGMDSHLDLIAKLSSVSITDIESMLADDFQNSTTTNTAYFKVISAMLRFVAEETARNYAMLSGEEL